MSTYAELYRRSFDDPEGFWMDAAEAIHWDRRPDRALDAEEAPFYRWFPGGRLNTCYNALDRHVENGRADQAALVYDSPITGKQRTFTYRELRDEVARFADVLRSQGVGKGDRVVIYMPMIPEAVVAMLACARLGAVHSVVFGGFAAHELAVRIDDAQPTVVVTASCGIEPTHEVPYKPLLDEALRQATFQPSACIIKERPEHRYALTPGRDIDWDEAMADAEPVGCVPVEATDPLYVLYTSGTTGKPKGVVRDNGGHAVALRWSMEHLYGVRPGEAYWAASDVGWVVGHSYIVYGPLLNGNTTILFEGKPVGTPDPGVFWRVVAEHDVKVLFTAPTAIRAIKREDSKGEYLTPHDLAGFRALFLAGERCDPDTLGWAGDLLGVPVIDHWWQTETGWPICCNPLGVELLPIKPGSAGPPVPGYDVRVLDHAGQEAPPDEIGSVVVKLPLPPGTLPTLWHDDAGYRAAYLSAFDGYYLTADAGFKDEDGYLWIMSRIDDIINVAGHRLSTGAMEEVLAAHPAVAECAVIGAADDLRGEVPVGFFVMKSSADRDPAEIARELVQAVREQIGPVASFKKVALVQRLPKTRSGKVLRGTIKKIADGKEYRVPATIDDPATLDGMAAALATLGYPHKPVGA